MDARSKVTTAIRKACVDWPAVATALLRLRPTEKQGIGTFGADKYFRFNYDPETVEQTTLNDLVYQIKLDVLCPLLRYHQRGQSMIFDGASHKAFSTASELLANQILADDYQHVPEDAKTFSNTLSPDGTAYPQGLCLEEYFSIILQQIEEEEEEEEEEETPPGETAGPAGETVSPPADCVGPPDETAAPDKPSNDRGGSSRDGITREWEDDKPDDSMEESQEGVSDSELDKIIERVAEQQKAVGRGGGSGLLNALGKSAKPSVRPETLLKMAISKSITKFRRGTKQQSYRRPSRRQQIKDKFIRPSYIDPTPKVTVVVDTSASMNEQDQALGLGMIDLALKGMKLDHVRVVGADTDIRSDQKNVRRLRDIKLRGCGGTMMDYVVNKILSEPAKQLPDLVILVTDGGTSWPDKHKVPFVACVTTPPGSWLQGDEPPSWMPYVNVG